jgi:alpha-galactosidase
MERTPLLHGSMSVNSHRGASSHYHNPFAALVTSETTEESGMAVGMSLIYSGNFDITADVDAFGLTRLMAGISPDGFEWHLDPGAQFVTPEAVIILSGEGLGKMSRVYHKLYRKHLCRGEWADKERPILVNNWEATYFNFDDEKLAAIAEDAAKCGIEMLVMDDGWFGIRNDDRSSLGDWFVNEDKIRCGLGKLVEKVNHRENYDDLAEQIHRLQAEKAQRESNSATKKRNAQAVRDLQEFIRSQGKEITEYDEKLVRRLVERITISDKTVTVQFKSGQSVEIQG